MTRLLKNHGEVPGARLGLEATRDSNIHGTGRIVPAELKLFERHCAVFPEGPIDGEAELRGMSLFDHLEQIETGIAGRKRQVLAGGTVKMQAVAAFIDQDIAGFDIAMDHAARMSITQSIADLSCNSAHLWQ